MTEEIVRVEAISKEFLGVTALSNVNLRLNKGEIHGLVGENGAGKSTLINILAGAFRPSSGSLFISGKPVLEFQPSVAQSLGISVVYQETVLVPDFTAEENIWLGREDSRNLMIDKAGQKKKTVELCEEYGISVPLSVPMSSCRVAEKKLVEILRALSMNVKVFILDEPTEALSKQDVDNLFRILSSLKTRGFAILFVSHHLEEVFRICDRITILRNGEEVGNFLPEELTVQSLIHLITNRNIGEQYPAQHTRRSSEPILEIKNLDNENLGLSNISFHVDKGEIVAFFGMVGSHRTELMKCLFGAEKAGSGEVIFKGRKIKLRYPGDAIKKGIYFCPEDRKLEGFVPDMSILDNCTLPFLGRFTRGGVISKSRQSEVVEKVIKDLSVKTPSADQKIIFLSGGNQQKIVIGKWLIGQQGELFIFDEPTKGVDVGTKMDIYKAMEELAEKGSGVIFVSSDLRELLGVSDRLYVMRKGEVVKEYSREQFDQHAILMQALTEKNQRGEVS